MNIESIITGARRQILASESPEQATETLREANRQIDDTWNQIVEQQGKLENYADFMRSKLAGNPVYTLPERAAAWTGLARGYNDHEPSLACGLVTEYDGRLWLMCSDAWRLHAHVIDDVPPGLYYMADNMLAKAEDTLKAINYVSVIKTKERIGLLPSVALGKTEYCEVAGWRIEGRRLVGDDYERCNYHIQWNYRTDALSLDPWTPTYGHADEPLKFSTPLHLFWDDRALAVIMPLNLSHLEK